MKKALLALAAVAVLAGCAGSNQCVQPDPLQPAYSNDTTLKHTTK